MPGTKKLKILIVENEEALAKIMVEKLQEQGFVTLRAANGQVGLMQAQKEKPALILLDVLMPVMDGLTMMDKLRQSGSYGKTVPIILLTNMSAEEEEMMKGIAKNEPSFYLIKSDWELSAVIDKIKELLA